MIDDWSIEIEKPMVLQIPEQTEEVRGKWHKNWFSNMMFFDSPLVYQGIEYKSSENFYQAMKLPQDRVDLRAEIAALTPQKSKTAIRDQVKYKWDENWNREKCLKVMEFALRHKFYPGTSWHKKLMETGDYAEALIAIWDGVSRGTKDMIDYATAKGLKVYVYIVKNI
jgi:predicted NAD-dependent protein-ADP-ribosyltransferase YbiA (DUF1768 family)